MIIESGLTTESFLPSLHDSASYQPDIRCGDLLLTFPDVEDVIPSRYSHNYWRTSLTGEGWQLLHDDTKGTWKGYPVVAGGVEEWNFCLLGELNGQVSSQNLLDSLHSIVLGKASAESLNGHFLLLAYNQQDGRWHVFTDRFGTFHAYYGSDGRRCALGTFSPAVAAVASRKQLDWSALAAFFAQGFFPGARTFFADVQILEPASHYAFDASGKIIAQTRYWNWWHDPKWNRSYDDTVDQFSDIFREVMQDLTRDGRVALPISGGLDSRSTTTIYNPVETSCLRENIWAYSYGYAADSPETQIARRVAKTRSLPFQAFTIKPYLFPNLDLVLDSVEGFQDITQCRQAAVLNEIAPRADYVIAAHWGDVWMDTMGFAEANGHENKASDLDSTVVDHTVRKITKAGSQWLLRNISDPQLHHQRAEELLLENVKAEISKLKHIGCPDFRVKAFKTDNWSFRWTTTSLRMFQPAAFPRLPFYDSRLVDFFCTVPSEFLKGRRLQVDYMKRYAPDLARIIWQARDANLFTYQSKSKVLPRRAAKKVWRLLTQKKLIERNWEIQLFSAEGRVGLDAKLMKPGLRIHEFVAPEKIKELLDHFYIDPYAEKRGYTVSMLVTLSVWLEKYG
jgi:hypothetical protein